MDPGTAGAASRFSSQRLAASQEEEGRHEGRRAEDLSTPSVSIVHTPAAAAAPRPLPTVAGGELAGAGNAEGGRQLLEVGCVTEQSAELDAVLHQRIIGQDGAVEAMTCAFSRVLSGLRDPSRPALSVLLLGPTGVGKTETARALAQALFGSEQAMTRIDCEEYAHGHELSKLLGSPPGYVGHEIEPLLSQRRIDLPHRQALAARTGMFGGAGPRSHTVPADEERFLSVILFDEIEKAHPVLWRAMLGILEGGSLTLGDNRTTDFTRSIIVLTSNVGTREMSALLEHSPVGFHTIEGAPPERSLDFEKTARSAAREVFPLEFLNRLDEILVYSALERHHIERIFDKFLADIHVRAMNQAGVPLLIRVSPEATALVLERGTDLVFGARPLRRAMETELVDPLSRLIASHRVGPGDIVEVERAGDRLLFYRRESSDTGVVA